MVFLHIHPPFALPTLILLLLISFIIAILCQDPSSSSPSRTQCAPTLLPLTPCAPFVQGTAQTPAEMCCNNLKQLYSREPDCLCLLLNDSNLNSFPINNTLALQLPVLCSLETNITTCSGINGPSSPHPQLSFGTNTNSPLGINKNTTIAASPIAQVRPRTSIMGVGLGRSTGTKLKKEGHIALATAMASFLIIPLLD